MFLKSALYLQKNFNKTHRMDYHNDTSRISQSGLKLIMKAPALYYERYLKPTRKPHDTQAFVLGRAFHRAVTEPDTFFKHYIVAPGKIDRRTKAGKQKWAEFQAAAQGRVILQGTEETAGRNLDYNTIMDMSDSVRAHPVGKTIRAGAGEAEKVLKWEDPASAAPCKCMMDWLPFSHDAIIDLKSTDDASPEGAKRTVRKYGYDVQVAFYLDGLFQATGQRASFIFLFTEKKAPFLTAAYVLDEETIHQGRRKYKEALVNYMQ